MIPLPSLDAVLRVCAYAVVGVCAGYVGFEAGRAFERDRYAESLERATDTATYYETMADSAWALNGDRYGLAADEVRMCMGRPVWVETG